MFYKCENFFLALSNNLYFCTNSGTPFLLLFVAVLEHWLEKVVSNHLQMSSCITLFRRLCALPSEAAFMVLPLKMSPCITLCCCPRSLPSEGALMHYPLQLSSCITLCSCLRALLSAAVITPAAALMYYPLQMSSCITFCSCPRVLPSAAVPVH